MLLAAAYWRFFLLIQNFLNIRLIFTWLGNLCKLVVPSTSIAYRGTWAHTVSGHSKMKKSKGGDLSLNLEQWGRTRMSFGQPFSRLFTSRGLSLSILPTLQRFCKSSAVVLLTSNPKSTSLKFHHQDVPTSKTDRIYLRHSVRYTKQTHHLASPCTEVISAPEIPTKRSAVTKSHIRTQLIAWASKRHVQIMIESNRWWGGVDHSGKYKKNGGAPIKQNLHAQSKSSLMHLMLGSWYVVWTAHSHRPLNNVIFWLSLSDLSQTWVLSSSDTIVVAFSSLN